MLEVTKTSLRLHDSLSGLIGLIKLLYSLLWFITVSTYRLKSAMRRDTWVKFRRTRYELLDAPYPPVDPHGNRFNFIRNM